MSEASRGEGREAGEERADNGLGMAFRWCPPGTMAVVRHEPAPPTGDPAAGDDDEDGDEEDWDEPEMVAVPTSLTHTAGFWLGAYPVTQAEFEAIMGPGSNPSKFRDRDDAARRPVENVSWDDAVVFCRDWTERERRAGRLPAGWAYRLPTQGQWDYACRAGGETTLDPGDEARFAEYAWFRTQASRYDPVARQDEQTHPVGLKRPNAWGLHDMQGNVAEWCRDAAAEAVPEGADPVFAPEKDDDDRGSRGGNYRSSAWECDPAFRRGWSPTSRYASLGFRVALARLAAGGPDDPRERTARSPIRTSRKAAVEGRPVPAPPGTHEELGARIAAFLERPAPGGKTPEFYEIGDALLRQYLDGEFPPDLTEARGLLVLAAQSVDGDVTRLDGDEEDHYRERAALYRGMYRLLYDEDVEDFDADDHEWGDDAD